MATVILLNPFGTDVTPFLNGTAMVPQLLKGTLLQPGDTLYTLPYNNDVSGLANIEHGVELFDAKVRATSGPMRVFGYSEGCQIADMWLSNQGASTPIDPSDLDFLLIGNANRKYGGFAFNQPAFASVGYTLGKPANTAYSVTDFARQYDGIADFPGATAVVNALDNVQAVAAGTSTAYLDTLKSLSKVLGSTPYSLAMLNALAGAAIIHNVYLYVAVDTTAGSTSSNVTLVEGNITWMWAPTNPVPLLGFSAPAFLDKPLRTQIEKAFTRPVTLPAPAGE